MSGRQQALFWLAVTLALIIMLSTLRQVLLPFVLGAGIAYCLDPIADRLQGLGLSRLAATSLIAVVATVLLFALVVGLLPLLIDQLASFAAGLPNSFQKLRVLVTQLADSWLSDFSAKFDLGIEDAVKQIAQKVPSLLQKLALSVWSGGMAFVNFLALLVVTPVVAVYLLKDWDNMIAKIDSWLPRAHAETIRGLASEIDMVISGFIRGQGTVLVLLSIFYVIGLNLMGLDYALLIGLGAGLISFIPYVGAIVGFVIGGTVAMIQFWPDWWPILGVLGVFIVGQTIEGNVLSPLIVGDRVGLHPVWLILALFVFSFLFGMVGLLLAVPLAAAIGVLVRFALGVYLQSDFYQGDGVAANTGAKTRRRKRG